MPTLNLGASQAHIALALSTVSVVGTALPTHRLTVLARPANRISRTVHIRLATDHAAIPTRFIQAHVGTGAIAKLHATFTQSLGTGG